jgi:hypothetical protein
MKNWLLVFWAKQFATKWNILSNQHDPLESNLTTVLLIHLMVKKKQEYKKAFRRYKGPADKSF